MKKMPMKTLENKWEIEKISTLYKATIAYVLGLILLFFVTLSPVTAKAANSVANQQYVIKVQYNNGLAIENIRARYAPQIPVRIEMPNGLSTRSGKKAWLRILGLPENLKFSKGAQVNQIWFIPSQDTDDLSILLPKGYSGSFNLNFFLMRGEQTVVSIIGKKKINVAILAALQEQPTQKQSSKVKAEPVPQAQVEQEKLTKQEETILLSRAAQLMKLGTFAPARLIYEELALRGSAKAAEQLARSYDPTVTQNSSISGMEPDADAAQKWYEHARGLRNQAIN